MKSPRTSTTTEMSLDFDGPPSQSFGAAKSPSLPLSLMTVLPPIGQLPRPCMLAARNDAEAIEAWIAARCDDAARDRAGRPAHSARAYRREAQRFLLWLRSERGVPLAGATVEDCTIYKAFMADPQPASRWCGPRGSRQGSLEWRPFEGPLGTSSRRQAMTILSGLYRFLQDQRYLAGNPWSGVAMPRNSQPRIETGRSLTRAQWAALERHLNEGPQDSASRQLAWAVRFLYQTGLRLAEISGARCGDLRWVEFEEEPGDALVQASWVISVRGKGLKLRDVPVSSALVDSLGERLFAEGGCVDPRRQPDRPLLLVRGGAAAASTDCDGRAQSAQALYRQLKRLFARVAERMATEGRIQDSQTFAKASTHWLRHSHCTHAIAAGTPLDVVRANAGHASLNTTSVYVRPELARRVREGRRLASLGYV